MTWSLREVPPLYRCIGVEMFLQRWQWQTGFRLSVTTFQPLEAIISCPHLSRNPTILQMLAAYLPHHPQLPGPGTATQPRLLNSTISMMFLQTKRQGERRLLSEETVPGKQPSPTDHLLIRAPPEVLELLSPLLSFLHLNLKATHGQELQLSNS